MDEVTRREDVLPTRDLARVLPNEPDQDRWRQLLAARRIDDLADAWLALLSAQIPRMLQGVVAAVAGENASRVVSVWPPNSAVETASQSLIERAIAQNKTLMQRTSSAGGGLMIAAPVSVDHRVRAAIAVTLMAGGDHDPMAALRPVQWSLAWIELALRREQGGASDGGELTPLVDLSAEIGEARTAHQAALALVTDLARRLDCDRVTLGFRRGLTTRLHALSHSATFGRRTQLMRGIAQAMDEAIDQGLDIAFPPGLLGGPAARKAHEALVRGHGASQVLTVQFGLQQGAGALTFERSTDRPFTWEEIALCRNVAQVIGPGVRSRFEADRPFHQIAFGRLVQGLAALLGPRHLLVKLVILAVAGALFASAVVRIEYRVAANAVIEGTERRVVSAPFEGYIGEAHARSGDVVRKDDLLARLDDRDLQVERQKWSVEATKHRQKFAESLSENQRAEALIARAKLDQANAQLVLLDSMIARTKIVAPFDGTVVTGDLSQSLGSAVSRGQALFEMAPLGSYRVKLKVDERDIARIAVGQKGELTLAPFPTQTFPIEVEHITLVSTPEDGINYFAVDARMPDETATALRPGMAGLAKVAAGPQSIFWIYAHRLIDTIRLWLWSI
jgi:RND family efflux transporter MFP subunit